VIEGSGVFSYIASDLRAVTSLSPILPSAYFARPARPRYDGLIGSDVFGSFVHGLDSRTWRLRSSRGVGYLSTKIPSWGEISSAWILSSVLRFGDHLV